MTRTARDLIQHIHYLTALFEDGSEICIPGHFADSLYSGVVLFFNGGQLKVRKEAVFQHPLTHFVESVELFLKSQSFACLISFMTARSGMTLRLGHFGHMHKRRNVMLARSISCLRKGLNERGVIPGAYTIKVEAII